jgi:hypothetical protein
VRTVRSITQYHRHKAKAYSLIKHCKDIHNQRCATKISWGADRRGWYEERRKTRKTLKSLPGTIFSRAKNKSKKKTTECAGVA